MKSKSVTGIFLSAIFFCCVMSAHASYVVDTGIPTDLAPGGGGVGLDRWVDNTGAEHYQWLAGRFSLSESYTVRSIEGYFSPNAATGNVTIAIYGETTKWNFPPAYPNYNFPETIPDTANQYLSGTFVLLPATGYGWQGIFNQNVQLAPGNYWVAFEVRSPEIFGTTMAVGSSLPNPLSLYHFASDEMGGYGPGGMNPIAVRIGDVAAAPVPIPGAIWLLGPALAGLVGFKRKYLG